MSMVTKRSAHDRPFIASAAIIAAFCALAMASCAGAPEPATAAPPAAPAAAAPTPAAPPAAPAPAAQPKPEPKAWSLPAKPVSAWKLPDTPGAFMKANLGSLERRTLSNGVEVIVKKNPANRVFSLKLVLEGGAALASPDKAGLEAMTLATMVRGSAEYPYSEIQRLRYETSSGIGYSAASYDMASLELNTIDTYWDALFKVFVDCVTRPSFDPAQFAQVQNDFRVAVQKTMSDPYSYAVSKLHDSMFAGHPYAADFQGTAASVASITLDDVKRFYESTMSADRMFVVAVGNFDVESLVSALEASIGRLPRKAAAKPKPPRLEPKPGLQLEAFDKSKGIAYVRGDYPIADPASPDFVTLQLAYSMLDELLFSIVRTDHGACYSTWSRAYGFASPYASLVVFKTDKPGEVKLWVDEAIALLASGKTMNVRGGDDKYAPIESTIEAYKAKYVNAFFGNQQTNAETASQLASSRLYFGDHAEYLRFVDKIGAVSAADVVAAVKAYVVGAPIRWIVVADKPTLSTVDPAAYASFTGTVAR